MALDYFSAICTVLKKFSATQIRKTATSSLFICFAAEFYSFMWRSANKKAFPKKKSANSLFLGHTFLLLNFFDKTY